jgi:hypothetical protein
MAHHVGIEMAALASVDLYRRGACGPDAFGIVAGLLIALDDGNLELALERLDGLDQQGGFAGPGTRNQIQGKYALGGKLIAVLRGIGIILRQDVLFELDRSLAARCLVRVVVPTTVSMGLVVIVGMTVCGPIGVGVGMVMRGLMIMRPVGMGGTGAIAMIVRVTVRGTVRMGMRVGRVMHRLPVDFCFSITTTACCTHHLSRSLSIRQD